MEGRKNLVRCAPVERKAVVQLCAAACGGNVARMSARGQEPGEGSRAEAKRVDAAPGAEWDGFPHGRSVHLTWRAICVYNGERFNLSDMMRRTRWNVRRVQYGRAD